MQSRISAHCTHQKEGATKYGGQWQTVCDRLILKIQAVTETKQSSKAGRDREQRFSAVMVVVVMVLMVDGGGDDYGDGDDDCGDDGDYGSGGDDGGNGHSDDDGGGDGANVGEDGSNDDDGNDDDDYMTFSSNRMLVPARASFESDHHPATCYGVY